MLQDEFVMNEILRRWTASAKNPSNVDGVVRSVKEIVSSEMKKESEKEEEEKEEEVDEKTRKLLEEAKRFSMQQQKERMMNETIEDKTNGR